MASAMYRLVYRSLAEGDVARALHGIAEAGSANNAASGLTGALLHSGSHFVEVLEGELAAVEATFERIAADLRHRGVELLQFTPVGARIFPGWTVAHVGQDWVDGLMDLGAVRADGGLDVLEEVLVSLSRGLSPPAAPMA